MFSTVRKLLITISRVTKAFSLPAIPFRGYGTCSQGVPVSGIPDYVIKTIRLKNKILVTSAENESLVSRVSIVFRAGARKETTETLGATHMLRVAAGLSTRNVSQFAITRNLQQVGSSITCSTGREIIAYTLEGIRPVLEQTLPYLTEVATQHCFRPWELSDNIPRLRLALASRSLQSRAVDLLHRVAYRNNGLGNSLYIPKRQIGKFSAECLQHYVTKNFTARRTAVVGLGVNHEDLVKYAEDFQLEKGSASTSKTNETEYKGGEIRSDKGGDLAHIAIAGKGGSFTNAKEMLSFAVLQRALGTGSSIKHTKEQRGIFAKILANTAHPSSITALNINYSDAGLFGALISAPSADAGAILAEVVGILKCGSVYKEDIQRGKEQLKTAVLLALENGATAVEDMGIQAVLTGSVANGCQIAAAIDGLKISNIKNAMKKVASSKLSVASVGNLRCVPFLDELTR